MRISKVNQPEKAVSKDKWRLAISEPYLDAKAEKLIATDGTIMVMIPADLDEDDVSGYVPITALKEARRAKTVDFTVVGCNGTAKLLNGAQYPRMDMTFPDWKSVIPDPVDRQEDDVIMLDPYKLHDLAQAMGVRRGDGVKLSIKSPANPIVVNAVEASNDSSGIIMPIAKG